MAHSYITDEMQCDLRFAILHVNGHENKNLICVKFSFFFRVISSLRYTRTLALASST